MSSSMMQYPQFLPMQMPFSLGRPLINGPMILAPQIVFPVQPLNVSLPH